jgi:CRP-like cAMP-binding protein
MTKDLKPLVQHIERFVLLSHEAAGLLDKYFVIRNLKNKQHLLEEGQVCSENYFLIKGCLRKYVNTEGGEKQIFQFAIENWWMTDYTSLESGKPSECNIQAVEECVVACISNEHLENLYSEVPAMETYFRKILQRAYEASLSRIHVIFSFSGEQRYQRFTSAFPEFVQRIPQYMLASYLGFTPEFLSKLRAKRKPV